jgi:eukaryotic-like serine/threonine-protein kinase
VFTSRPVQGADFRSPGRKGNLRPVVADPSQFGPYRLMRKLATGGMGQVWLARLKGSTRRTPLVVKRLLPHLSEEPEFIEMFLEEARVAAILKHPNIVRIHDVGDVDGAAYIAMEYVHGVALRDIIDAARQQGHTVPLAAASRIIGEAAAGLDFAHRATGKTGQPLGLIHRDVSPHNILVGFDGVVKLIDFGVARAAGRTVHTAAGNIKGKYPYMSPEQAAGRRLDLRSDVFSLGAVLYETLTGNRVFKRESESSTRMAVIDAKVQAPSALALNIPRDIDAISLRALSKNREERFQTAGELKRALDAFAVRYRVKATRDELVAYLRLLLPDQGAERDPDELTLTTKAALR